MTHDESTFLAALRAHPDDDEQRLAYTAWLDARGDARGRFLHLDLALAGMLLSDPQAAALGEELDALERKVERGWLVRVGQRRHERFDVVLTGLHLIPVIVSLHLKDGLGLTDRERLNLSRRLEQLPLTLGHGLRRAEAQELHQRLAFRDLGPFDEAYWRQRHAEHGEGPFDAESHRAAWVRFTPICDIDLRLNHAHTWAETLRSSLPQPVRATLDGEELLLEAGEGTLVALSATPARLEVQQFGAKWTSPHSLERDHQLYRFWSLAEAPEDPVAFDHKVRAAVAEVIPERLAHFVTCRLCGQMKPPELIGRDDTCYSCGERHLGWVH